MDDPRPGSPTSLSRWARSRLLLLPSQHGVQYTATIDCNSFNPPLDGAQVVTVTAVNGNDVSAVATLPLNVDNAGPTISATLPAIGQMIGGVTSMRQR